jgi:hypothetical protein
MNKSTPLIMAGLVFSVVALAHLLRLIYRWDVMIAGVEIPMTVSIAAVILAFALAIWMFITASRN